jgi:hypothetical protein
MVPDFLVVGHVCRDLHESGYRLGGAASYASLTAQRLGLHAAVLTRSAETNLASQLPGVELLNLPSQSTLTFRNEYVGGRRRQHVYSVPNPIPTTDLPPEWANCPIVLLGPLAQEVEPSLAERFAGGLVGISPQGWMRRWDGSGLVSPVDWDGTGLEEHAQVVVAGENDFPPGKDVSSWLPWIPTLIVTESERGARMRQDGVWYRVPAYPAREVDPTGAGDVFAAAFLIRLHETRDPFESSLFASAAASICVEGVGLEGIPTREQVQARLRRYPQQKIAPL